MHGLMVRRSSIRSLLLFNELWTAETDTTGINWCKWLWRIYCSADGLRQGTNCEKNEMEEEEEGCV